MQKHLFLSSIAKTYRFFFTATWEFKNNPDVETPGFRIVSD
jgi:hypothetical protein